MRGEGDSCCTVVLLVWHGYLELDCVVLGMVQDSLLGISIQPFNILTTTRVIAQCVIVSAMYIV